ncbi:MAG: RNase P modulator RnpM [Bacillales bacterium]
MKKIPLRKCLASNMVYPKKELFRVVITPEKSVLLDVTGKINGRGAYIHMDKDSVDIAKKTKCLDKALKTEIPEKIYIKMMYYIENGGV